MAMHRPTRAKQEHDEKIKTYGGSRQAIDYKRNIYGEHGDASDSVFVLARFTACVGTDDASSYDQDVYEHVVLTFERLPVDVSDQMRQGGIMMFLQLPGTHKAGWSMKNGTKEVGAPKGYSAHCGGMDVVSATTPSEASSQRPDSRNRDGSCAPVTCCDGLLPLGG